MFTNLFKNLYFLVFYTTLLSARVLSKIYFQEEFLDGDKWQERWILSEHPSRQWGFFILSTGQFYGDPKISKGIQTYQNNMRYGISLKFQPFSNKDRALVLQFTVKHEQDMTCGGGYIKMFDCSLNPEELNENTPYLIMFGPDKCIPEKMKVHVILQYEGKYHNIKKNIFYKDDTFTHLYTLVINPDNTYIVKVDNVDVASGKLKDDFDFYPPERIPDYKAEKPLDWDDNPTIDDPNDRKPEDWDLPQYLPDPSAIKPADWDESIDGEWEPPLVDNPDFKGPWKPRRIRNPNYKGTWTRPTKKNPKYTENQELYKFDEICAVGFDVWQVESGSVFDNILVTDDMEFAEEQGWKMWGSLKDEEIRMAKQTLQIWSQNKKRKHIHDEL